MAGETAPVFPHNLAAIQKQNNGTFGLLKTTPFGCTVTTEMAMEAVKNEMLGKDDYTDMLCISYSSPDYVGHYYGIRSIEMEDIYLRLDREIESLLKFLDIQVGKGQYTVFLTADHAAAENAQMMIHEKIPAGYFDEEKFTHDLNNHLVKTFKLDTTYIIKNINQQIYFNHNLMRSKGIDADKVVASAIDFISEYPGITDVVGKKELMSSDWNEQPRMLIRNGFMPSRSGDIVYTLLPGYVEYEKTGTTHGSHYSYDTHVPLLFMGKKIPVGKSSQKVYITSIAPTLSVLLGIPYPSACSGSPLKQMLDK
jgi:predicted AlkP superfamily pyrophosphatase or phosphodiesterase